MSFDDEEAYQKVEIIVIDEIINSTKVPENDSSSAASSTGKNLNSQRDDSSDKTEKLLDMKFTIKRVRHNCHGIYGSICSSEHLLNR